MQLIETLKSIDCLRRPIKKMKIWKEYLHDAASFNKYYMEECDRKGNYDYRMLMLIHNIEKGMCMPNPRPFGQEKVRRLMHMLGEYEKAGKDRDASVYNMVISIVYQWTLFYENHGWTDDTYTDAKAFLTRYSDDQKAIKVGYDVYSKEELTVSHEDSFDKVVKTRKSVRSYMDIPLKREDVLECVQIAQCAPTACNRQMIGIVHVENRELCDLISETIYGASGFTTDTLNYFVVTFDINAFDYYGERNQGFLNAGLVAMNFVNALHSRGIGSCFLQWANTAGEDEIVRKKLGIAEHERIAVVIAAGYYMDYSMVARSSRRKKEEIYRRINA